MHFGPTKQVFYTSLHFGPTKQAFHAFLDQQAFLLITLLRPSFSGILKFPDLFPNKPFFWELLSLCSKANCVLTILWIITKCFAIYLAASHFSYSDQINHPTRSMRRMLWRCWNPTVPYLLRPASRAIGHQTFLVPNWGYDPKKALD